MAVNERAVDALRRSMEDHRRRAIRGDAVALTWISVCKGAAVPLATGNRAKSLILEWKVIREKLALAAKSPAELDDFGELDVNTQTTVCTLRRTIEILANQIQALSLAGLRKDKEIERLSAMTHTKVKPIR